MMQSIASRLLLAVALVSAAPALSFADGTSSGRFNLSDAPLPAFVPESGSDNFKTAINDNGPSALAARQAAEAIGAKFSDITTGSIPHDDQPATPAPAREPDPPHVVTQSSDTRSIVLTARPSSERKKTSRPGRSHQKAGARNEKPDRIPRSAIQDQADSRTRDQSKGKTFLAAIGEKVGIFNLLTNPALWK